MISLDPTIQGVSGNIHLFRRALVAAETAPCVDAERFTAVRHFGTMLCGRASVLSEAWRIAGVRRLINDRRSSVKE
jgi:hypothetical protein